MLLLSFASQTSHFWQLGGVMQAKMRSLLRLLVKSIIEDRKRQADANAAREAHHSASPAADTSAQNTQDTGTEAGTDTHAHSYAHANRELTRNGKLAPRNRFQHFYCHYGTHLHFFFVKRQLEMRENPWWRVLLMSWQSIATAICLGCFMSDYQ